MFVKFHVLHPLDATKLKKCRS